jgi:23S rRNA (uracil1939-C5)-methyltransferase
MARFYRPEKKAKSALALNYSGIVIDRLSDDGRGIASIQGKTVFVDGALVGETVSLKVTRSTARYQEASMTALTIPSPDRVDPICRYYSRCGGCHVQHMSFAEQQAFKRNTLLSQLQRWAGITPVTVLPTLFFSDKGYRQRVRLGVLAQGGKTLLGFRQKNSKQLIAIDECPVMLPRLSRLLQPLQQWLDTEGEGVAHIELTTSDALTAVVLRHTASITLASRQLLQLALLPLNATCWFQGGKQAALTDVNNAVVDPRLFYTLPDYGLSIAYHPQDFIQTNGAVNRQMVAQAIALLQPNSDEYFLDLFCGVGNFSLPLARHVKRVIGIEGSTAMVARAADNARDNQCTNARFLQADLFEPESLLANLGPCDGLILDPPRAGAESFCQNIAKLMPKRLVYVSCDSATFARDSRILCENGYQLQSLGMMDMFPHTAHSEVMGLFARSSWHPENIAG